MKELKEEEREMGNEKPKDLDEREPLSKARKLGRLGTVM